MIWFLYDCITTIIKLGILNFKDDGTKLSVSSNTLNFNEPTFVQGMVRYITNSKREDIHYLNTPIYNATLTYRQDNETIKYLFELAKLGLNKLKEERTFLKEKKRPQIVAAISEARSHGDLKENAEYHAAKEEQSHNEGRITEINDIIARANVIDVTKLNNEGKVIFGSTVFLENLDTGEKINYKIVGKDEADLKNKLIYFQSPIGKGLI